MSTFHGKQIEQIDLCSDEGRNFLEHVMSGQGMVKAHRDVVHRAVKQACEIRERWTEIRMQLEGLLPQLEHAKECRPGNCCCEVGPIEALIAESVG